MVEIAIGFSILLILAGYLVGCLQTAYFVGRKVGKIDIREHGSGNAGMTNVARVLGAKPGVIVLVADVAKAVAAIMVANYVFYGRVFGMQGIEYLPGLLAGLGVILGHNFPFWLKFRGGKGIASTIGLAIMFDWRVLAIAACIGILVLLTAKYMSLASLVALTVFAAVATILYIDFWPIVTIAWIIAALGFFTHRKNIGRLIKGTESKFHLKKP